jgi:hypothetical protein
LVSGGTSAHATSATERNASKIVVLHKEAAAPLHLAAAATRDYEWRIQDFITSACAVLARGVRDASVARSALHDGQLVKC